MDAGIGLAGDTVLAFLGALEELGDDDALFFEGEAFVAAVSTA
jgi:hypothetical protein